MFKIIGNLIVKHTVNIKISIIKYTTYIRLYYN